MGGFIIMNRVTWFSWWEKAGETTGEEKTGQGVGSC
jgi:hypothetical protein